MKVSKKTGVINELKLKIKSKKKEIKNCSNVITQLIKDKAELHHLESAISKRNSLFVDVSQLERQLKNISYGKLRFGEEVTERNVSKWIDLSNV